MARMVRGEMVVGTLVIGLVLVWGCQKVAEPVPILTQNQWQRVQEHILDERPDPERDVEAVFGGMVELVGFDIEPDVVELGDEFTVTWYWHVLQELDDRWEIFVHLDHDDQRQNLDHEAIGGLYTALYWEPGQFIRDIQTVRLEPHMGAGEMKLYVGLWRRVDGSRLPVSAAGQGTLEPDGRLFVGSFEATRELVSLQARRANGPMVIDGNLNESGWRTARQTRAFVHPNDGSEMADLRTQARAIWDDEALYIALRATDRDVWSTYQEDDSNLWEEEVLEVYLDPLGDGRNYVELQVNPLGAVFDARFAQADGRDPRAATEREWDLEGLEVGVGLDPPNALQSRDDTDRSWTVEMRIPWASLPDFGDAPADGDVIRANFYRYDRPQDGEARTVAWAPVYGGTFHRPDMFGEIRLVGGTGGEGDDDGGDGREPEETEEESGAAEGTGAGIRLDSTTLQIRQPMIPSRLRPVGTGGQP